MEECTGKALLEEKVKSLKEDNSKLEVETTKVANELVEKLEKALCCVTYPALETYFSWKHLRFKTKIVNKNITIKKSNTSEPNFKRIYVYVIANRPEYVYDYKSIKLEFNVFAHVDKNNNVTSRIRHDGDAYTPDEVLNKVIKEVANYTVKFNRENNVI